MTASAKSARFWGHRSHPGTPNFRPLRATLHHNVANELSLTAAAPPLLDAETPLGQLLNMALPEQRGYDPTTLSWSYIPTNPSDDGPSTISAEQADIFQLVEGRRRRRRNAEGASALKTPLNNSATGDARAPSPKAPQKTSPVSKWTPKPTVRMNPGDYVIVLKPRITVALKAAFQQGELGAAISQLIGRQHMNDISISPNWEQNIIICGTQNNEVVQKLLSDFQINTSKGPLPLRGHLKLTGDVCRGVISVHNLETSASLKHSVQWRGGELVYARKLGNSNVAVLTFAGRKVPRFVHYNAELTPVREYKKTVPACYRCGALGHRADICPNPVTERCSLCGQNVGAGPEGMAPHECNPTCIVCGGPHLTSSRECTEKFIRLQQPGSRTSGTPTKPKHRSTGKVPIPGKAATATLPPGAAESPALGAPSGNAARNQPKVGSWVEVASSPSSLSSPPSSATSTTETQKLRHELALLRSQNEKLASELDSLKTNLTTKPSLSDEEENITDREIPTTVESRVAALETQVNAIETQLADLPKIIHDTIARHMETVIAQVTQTVTHIIQKWIQDNPRVLKRVGPIRDVNRPSKFNRVTPDESDFSEDSSTSAQGAGELSNLNNTTPPSISEHGLQP